MKNFKNSRYKKKHKNIEQKGRFIIEISTKGIKKPYLCRDTKFNHIVHKFEFKEDAENWCGFQNKNCTFGHFEFPKFMRPYD